MGASTRHYKALMKKNCINWKRTPCGSICEIVCPLMLMLILVYARSQIDPVYNDNYSLYSLRRPFYPVAKPDSEGKFGTDIVDQFRQLDSFRDFFEYNDAFNLNFTQTIDPNQALEAVGGVYGVTDIP